MSFDPRYHFSPLTGDGGGPLITRENYEKFFLLYVDHELNAAEQKAVEQFVQDNPDLGQELTLLQQSVITPDEQVVYTGKTALLKGEPQELEINGSNYEVYFLLYADNELTREQQQQVEQFVYRYPQYQAAFELMQQAVLTPDTSIVFPDKASLYRGAEERKVVPLKIWRRVAVAAVLLLVGGITWFMLSREVGESIQGGNIVHVTPEKVRQQEKETVPDVPGTDNNKSAQQPSVTEPEIPTDAIANSNQQRINRNRKEKAPKQPAIKIVEEEKQPALAQAALPEKNIQKESNPNNTSSVKPSAVAMSKPNTEEGNAVVATVNPSRLNTDTKAINTAAVTMPVEKESFALANEEEGETINTSGTRKNKMRGFFRKISRVVERTIAGESNGNEKGTVRIASFEFARNK